MGIEGGFGDVKQNKIEQLRKAISRAEAKENQDEIVLLEAELRAVEKGESFNREEFLRARSTAKAAKEQKKKTKHGVLREMQALPTANNDHWTYDGIHSQESSLSYEFTFKPILDQLGVRNFQELAAFRSIDLGRKIKVLDLFGGAYFLPDLEHVSKIVGVRLKNIDEKVSSDILLKSGYKIFQAGSINTQLKQITDLSNNQKRTVIEGNLYTGKTWKKLEQEDAQDITKGFDLMVCRPQGPFGHSSHIKNVTDIEDYGEQREELMVSLLERALRLLSLDGGLLITQMPYFKTEEAVWNDFWDKYVAKKEAEGYEFLFATHSEMPMDQVFAVRRHKKNGLK